MRLSIVSAGLVSPLGIGLAEHAFFARASLLAAAPQAFEDKDGERVDALWCGFLGATQPLPERLATLADLAADEALSPWEHGEPSARVGLLFVSPLRYGIHAAAMNRVCDAVAKRCRAPLVQSFAGAAGAFAALSVAQQWVEGGKASAALIVGVDSMISLAALADERRRAPSSFSPPGLSASEGAAAVLVAPSEDARARGLEVARIVGAGAGRGAAHDDDDVIVDGLGLTALIAGLPSARIGLILGQSYVDDLRTRDFQLASARTARRFDEDVVNETLERMTGRLGAAAGVAQLAYAVGAFKHGALGAASDRAKVLAWAVGADGTRGVALIEPAPRPSKPLPDAPLLAAYELPQLRAVSREPLPTSAEPLETETIEVAPGDSDDTSEDDEDWLEELLAGADEAMLAGSPPASPDAPPITLLYERAARVPLSQHYEAIVTGALETMALCARHRATRRLDERPDEEDRILALLDAIAICPHFPRILAAWWQGAASLPDPWKIWAPAFILASTDGDDAAPALATLAAQLDEGDLEAVGIAGEALSLGGRDDLYRVAVDLCGDACPAARAVGTDALARLGALSADELIARWTDDAPLALRWVLARASARLPSDRRIDDRLLTELNTSHDARVLGEVARALALRGSPAAYHAMKFDAALLGRFGPGALDVLALLGNADDGAIARRVVAHCGISTPVLRGLGRFGHAGAAPILLAALDDEDAAEDAAEALSWIFGFSLSSKDRTRPAAWRELIAGSGADERVRYRFGAPYAPTCPLAAFREAKLGRRDIERLLDEAAVRTGVSAAADAWRFSPAADPTIVLAAETLARVAPLGDSWRSATRDQPRAS